MAVLAAISLVLVAVVAIVAIVIVANGNAYQRYCILDETYLGSVLLNSNNREIEWDLQYTIPLNDPVLTVHIFGPIPPGLTDAPLFIPLCGVPSTLACDTSVPAVLKGKLTEHYSGSGLKTIIREIRAAPTRDYLEIGTAMNNTGLRAPLGTICGTP